MSQPAEPSRPSRRTFFRLSSGLLAVTAIGVPAGQADAASSAAGKNRSTNLAGFRPVQVSSTDYAPTPGEFAVDGISAVGSPAGTGWRAAAGDPQWISVDLQAVYRVQNTGATVAPMVVLSLRANGERVLPTVYSDNYLWLLPAESRDIDIDCATTDLGSHSPAVQVTAYGATPTTVSA